jgi:hypothetical protein
MVGPSADLTTEWEGGSLGELVSLLQTSAMPVRIEVIAPGTTSNAGEVHLLAGGLADAFAGSLRRDDAMAALQRLEGARFVVEARLPDPESGSLATPGPREGSLKDRPVASLMRYCEDYVLTCRLEVWRGPDRAAISYRRGEIISTMVGGADGSERLPEVMGWTDGSYEIILPAPVLPQAPSRRGARATDPMAKVERKRHTTLPMTPGSGDADAMGSAPSSPSAARPVTSPPPLARPAPPAPASAAKPAPPVPAAPAKSPPSSPATTTARLSPPVQTAPAPAKPAAPAPATSSAAQPPSARPQPAQQPQPRQAQPAAASPGGVPATTLRGPSVAPPGPAGAPAPAPVAAKAAPAQAVAPASQTARAASRPASPPVPAEVQSAQPVPGPTAGAKPQGRTPTPAMGTMAAPMAPEMTARGTPPVPAVPLIPARPAKHTTPPPITPAKAVATSTDPRAGKAEGSTPPVVPVPPAPAPFQLAQPAPARTAKPAPAPASNDLKPASGTIEAKARHSNHLPPAPAPIEIADQPSPTPEAAPEPAQPVNQVMIPSRPTTSRRARVARKGLGEHSVKVYVLIGLAIGAGIVVAYWAYWYLPFFHH